MKKFPCPEKFLFLCLALACAYLPAHPAPARAADAATAEAEKDYQKYLEQGFYMTSRREFTVGDASAKLVGVGAASLNNRVSSINPGQGAMLDVTFSDIHDPVFQKCRPLLEAEVPNGKLLAVFGHGSYQPVEHNGVDDLVVFHLTDLTSCELSDVAHR